MGPSGDGHRPDQQGEGGRAGGALVRARATRGLGALLPRCAPPPQEADGAGAGRRGGRFGFRRRGPAGSRNPLCTRQRQPESETTRVASPKPLTLPFTPPCSCTASPCSPSPTPDTSAPGPLSRPPWVWTGLPHHEIFLRATFSARPSATVLFAPPPPSFLMRFSPSRLPPVAAGRTAHCGASLMLGLSSWRGAAGRSGEASAVSCSGLST